MLSGRGNLWLFLLQSWEKAASSAGVWGCSSDPFLGQIGSAGEPAWPPLCCSRMERICKLFWSGLISQVFTSGGSVGFRNFLAGFWLPVCLEKFLLAFIRPIASCTSCQQGKHDFNLLLTCQNYFFLCSPADALYYFCQQSLLAPSCSLWLLSESFPVRGLCVRLLNSLSAARHHPAPVAALLDFL